MSLEKPGRLYGEETVQDISGTPERESSVAGHIAWA
jgi:hypothetical protein